MPACSICGISRISLTNSVVEGTLVSVCEECAKFGKIVRAPAESNKKVYNKPAWEMELIDEVYSDKIRRARERKRLNQEELAKNLAEKLSTIHGVESGKLKPDLKLARKLEVFLNIKIITAEVVDIKKTGKIDFSDSSLTIGDILRMKNDK